MQVTFSVANAGASRYAGSQDLRNIVNHHEITIGTLNQNSSAGDPVIAHQPHLVTLAERTFAPTVPEDLAKHDVVILALPHGASGELTAAIEALPGPTPLL